MAKDKKEPTPPPVPCHDCGNPVTAAAAVTVEPYTGLPATGPAGRPFHKTCLPPQRQAACYVCHMEAPDDYDQLEAAGWACDNCGHEVITFAWGRAEARDMPVVTPPQHRAEARDKAAATVAPQRRAKPKAKSA